jgi:hypothetical protein
MILMRPFLFVVKKKAQMSMKTCISARLPPLQKNSRGEEDAEDDETRVAQPSPAVCRW